MRDLQVGFFKAGSHCDISISINRHKHKNCKCEPAQHKHKHLIATTQAYLHSVHVYLHSVIQDGEHGEEEELLEFNLLLLS